MNKKLITLFVLSTLLVLPVATLAVTIPPLPGDNLNVSTVIDSVINFIWPFFAGFSVVMFIVAGFQFLTANGDLNKIVEARRAVVWGMIGVAVGLLSLSIPFIIQSMLGV